MWRRSSAGEAVLARRAGSRPLSWNLAPVVTVILRHGHPVLIAVIALIAAAIAALIFILVTKRKERAHN
jgi:hypothetical protein